MPVLTPQQFGDLVETTQRKMGKRNFTEIATDLQEHTAFNELILRNKVEEQGGIGVEWYVMVNHSNAAENVGIGSPDNPTIVDTMETAQADWRGSTANYSIFAEEISMNSGDDVRLVNLLQTRDIACRISTAALM